MYGNEFIHTDVDILKLVFVQQMRRKKTHIAYKNDKYKRSYIYTREKC